ncbi:MAG: XTP/dITP diphosphatase [Euryarchaeota archaeon]|jgi:XTP/dITP diphosphohydrolase|nr:XTP/dITP diphosphatase [Euryarchaeota archaeon]
MLKESQSQRTITFITGNQHKVKEAQGIFNHFQIEVEHVDLGYPEIQGELDEVARYGARYAAKRLDKPVIVEDAGLFIRDLGWFPGTYSAYVQSTLKNRGILKLMEDVQDRYAEFRSVVGFATPKAEPEIFLGVVEGKIIHEERGEYGFAYDPIFVPNGYDKTFGELKIGIKNRFSHRRRSLEKFALWFEDYRGD